MAIPKYVNHIDMNTNEIRNVAFEKTATLPGTPFNTQHTVDTSGANDIFKVYLNGVWRSFLLGDPSNGTGLSDIDVTGTAALAKSLTGSVMALTIANADSTNPGLLTSADYDLLNGATSTAGNDTLVKRDATGSAVFTSIALTSGTITTAPAGVNDIVNKSYVDSAISSGSAAINDFDASTNPDYPAASKGDIYHVTSAGTVGDSAGGGTAGDVLEVGDMLKAKVTTAGGTKAAVGGDWIILQNNLGQASTTVTGYSRFATQAEVNAGSLTNVAVSPATMAASSAGTSTGLIGDGSTTDIVYTHSLNNQYCIVQVFDAATNSQVQCGVELTSSTTCTLNFSTAPASNEFRVVVSG